MKVTECLCDMCEKVKTEDDSWITITDQYKVMYHFCSWLCSYNFAKGMDIYEEGLKKREAVGAVQIYPKLRLIKIK